MDYDMTPFGHKDYRRNQALVRGDADPCAYCGKAVEGVKHAVIVIDGGAAFGTRDDNESDPAHMGEFSVGPDCAKLLRKAGIAVY